MADSPRKKSRASATEKEAGASTEDASDGASRVTTKKRNRREEVTRRVTPAAKRAVREADEAERASTETKKTARASKKSKSEPSEGDSEEVVAPEKSTEKKSSKARKKASNKPLFAEDFPSDPALDRLLILFDQGNYAAVRKDAKALLASAKDDDVRAAVREIQRRLEPDSLAIGMVVMAALLLAILSGYYWTHAHETAPPAPTAPSPVSS